MEATEKPAGAEITAGLKLCQLGQEVSVPAGARIVSQGEAPEFFYVIQSGRVRVFRETADRIQTNLTELAAGAYFGEVALVTGQARSASVEALEDATLIKVSKEEFDRLLDQNPQLARHIIQQLASWLVAGDRRVEAEVVHQVKAAAALLVRLCPHVGLEPRSLPGRQHLQRQPDSPDPRLGRKRPHSRNYA